jgi:hypothetical protein
MTGPAATGREDPGGRATPGQSTGRSSTGRSSTGRGGRAGRTGLAAIGVSIAATFAVAVAGPSLMEPALPGRPGQPPWSFDLHLSAYAAVGLTAVGLAAGALGLVLVLRALRAGWACSARLPLLGGLAAATALTLVPPFGSSDPLSYAAYGRMVATGHNPYRMTPAQLAAHGDPVARAVQDWFTAKSVYGPLASAIEALASEIGGTSVRLTVFMLGVANLIAFAVTALLLHRMTAGRPGGQLRAALLWTANPLLLQVLIAGAHVDTQVIVFCVAAVAVMYGPWRSVWHEVPPEGDHAAHTPMPGRYAVWRAGVAGALVGLGFAVKVTAGLVGLGIAVALVLALRGQWRRAHWRRVAGLLAALAGGFVVVAGAALAIGGTPMLKTASAASDMVSIGSPWRVIRAGLEHLVGYNSATDIVQAGAIVLAALIAVLLARTSRGAWARGVWGDGIPPDGGSPGGRPPGGIILAIALGWLFAWPYVLPWYDALGWALLALVPASGLGRLTLDGLMLARTTALGFAYLPARTVLTNLPRTVDVAIPSGLRWLQPVFRNGVAPVTLSIVAVAVIVACFRYSASSDTGSDRSARAGRGSDRDPDRDGGPPASRPGGEGMLGADRR